MIQLLFLSTVFLHQARKCLINFGRSSSQLIKYFFLFSADFYVEFNLKDKITDRTHISIRRLEVWRVLRRCKFFYLTLISMRVLCRHRWGDEGFKKLQLADPSPNDNMWMIVIPIKLWNLWLCIDNCVLFDRIRT